MILIYLSKSYTYDETTEYGEPIDEMNRKP